MIELLELSGYPEETSNPIIELNSLASLIWGPQFDDKGKARWGWVDKVGGITINGGAVTDGQQYFTLDKELRGVRELNVAPDGALQGTTLYYHSRETNSLKFGDREVFW